MASKEEALHHPLRVEVSGAKSTLLTMVRTTKLAGLRFCLLAQQALEQGWNQRHPEHSVVAERKLWCFITDFSRW